MCCQSPTHEGPRITFWLDYLSPSSPRNAATVEGLRACQMKVGQVRRGKGREGKENSGILMGRDMERDGKGWEGRAKCRGRWSAGCLPDRRRSFWPHTAPGPVPGLGQGRGCHQLSDPRVSACSIRLVAGDRTAASYGPWLVLMEQLCYRSNIIGVQ